MTFKEKIVIVGAGPVGALAALYAAQRGHDVEPDLRDPSTVPLNFTKSINLALSERGINAIRHTGHPRLLESILRHTIPMRGRMIHGQRIDGSLYQASQDYDVHGRAILAIDRGDFNKRLLDALEEMPNVKIFFNHKLTGADFTTCRAWFEVRDQSIGAGNQRRAPEIEIAFDLMIGADGAHSAVRYHMMKFARMNYSQVYIDTLWCEFKITPRNMTSPEDSDSKFAISPYHLHIWPGKDFMFIAIPSEDGSFTCTLFMPAAHFACLESDPSSLPAFFDEHFPGVTELIPTAELIESFKTNPHLPLISIKAQPHHFDGSGVIVGDAANAMVPFYGQGMNTGLESVRVLFSFLDKHSNLMEDNSPQQSAASDSLHRRAAALAEFSEFRVPDVQAVIGLALENYIEMRASVLSPTYRLRKFLEETLSAYLPSLGWRTKYSRVSFENERFSDVVRNSERQGAILMRGLIAVICSPVVITGAVYLSRRLGNSKSPWKALVDSLGGWFGR